jgi:hypothetical protein
MDNSDEKNKTRFSSESLSLDNVIYEGNLIFENYKKDTDILSACNGVGYTEEVMAQGLALFDDLKSKIQNRIDEKSDKMSLFSDVEDGLKIAHDKYMRLLNFARIEFKGNYSVSDMLELDGSRQNAFPKKVAQMKRFYENVKKADVLAKLAKYNVTAESLQVDEKTLDDVIAVDINQEEKKVDTKNATKIKNDALNVYLNWINKFKKIIKVELKGQSVLEKIGY